VFGSECLSSSLPIGRQACLPAKAGLAKSFKISHTP